MKNKILFGIYGGNKPQEEGEKDGLAKKGLPHKNDDKTGPSVVGGHHHGY